jgi:hypothetical protein
MQKSIQPPALPMILFFGLFVVVGTFMWINILWGLLTGGPRDRTKMGQPYLYDRLYYLLMLVLLTGWTIAFLSFGEPGALNSKAAPSGFLIGWGIMAIGIGLFYPLRLEMMLNGAEYLANHGLVLLRPFHAMTVRSFQRQRQSPMLKIMPIVFAVVGVGVLAFNLSHIAEVPGQVMQGAQALIGEIQKLATGHA